MAMERIDAALQGWPQAPFRTKRETDANSKRMLEGMGNHQRRALLAHTKRLLLDAPASRSCMTPGKPTLQEGKSPPQAEVSPTLATTHAV